MSNLPTRTESDSGAERNASKGVEHEAAAAKLSHEAAQSIKDHSFAPKSEQPTDKGAQEMLNGFHVVDHSSPVSGAQGGEQKERGTEPGKVKGKVEGKLEGKVEGKEPGQEQGKEQGKDKDKEIAEAQGKEKNKDDKDSPHGGEHTGEKSAKHKQKSGSSEQPKESEDEEELKKKHLGVNIPAAIDTHSLSDLQGQKSAIEAMDPTSEGARAVMAKLDSFINQLHGGGSESEPPPAAGGDLHSAHAGSAGGAGGAERGAGVGGAHADQAHQIVVNSDAPQGHSQDEPAPDWMKRMGW